MKQIIVVIVVILLCSVAAEAASRAVLVNGNGVELGTSTNPLYVKGV